MNLFYRRPLAFSATLFALTAVLAFRMNRACKLLLLSLSALAFLILLGVFLWKRRSSALFCALLCLGAILLSSISSVLFFEQRYDALHDRIGENCQVEGYVLERMSGDVFYSYLRVHITEMNGRAESFDAIVELAFPSSLQAGDGFVLQGVPRDYTADEWFDEKMFRLADGCFLIFTVENAEHYARTELSHQNLTLFAAALNQRLSYLLRETVAGEEGGLCAALLLGNRTWLSDTTALAFRRAGISHLLALSGLHVSILIAFLEGFLRWLRAPRKLRAILIPLAALGYLLLTGCAVSTCRAVLMVCVLYLALLGGSRYDAFTALSTILALILLVHPWSVCDLSLWMSFLSAASIVIFSPALTEALQRNRRLQRLPKRLAKVLSACLSALFVGFVANLALMLLSASVFGELSLASIPATLLLSIPITCLLICSLLCLCLLALPLLPQICQALASLHLEVASFFSSQEAVMLPANDLPTQAILLLVTLSLIAIAVLPLRHPIQQVVRFLPAGFALAVLVSVCVTQFAPQYGAKTQTITTYFGELELHCEHGEAVLINYARGNTSKSFEIKQLALQSRCTDIDDLVFSRYYNQSTYFLARLCMSMRVEELHLPVPTTEKELAIAARLEQEASLYGVTVLYDAAVFLHSDSNRTTG